MAVGRRSGVEGLYLILLAKRLLDEITGMSEKPPVTLSLIVLQGLIHFGYIAQRWGIRDLCLLPGRMLANIDAGEWTRRIVISALTHGSDMHLFYNMISFLHKGATLEPVYGSQKFLALIVSLTFLSQLSHIFLSYAAAVLFDYTPPLRACSIGFSGVIFALSTIIYLQHSNRQIEIFGLRLPPKYVAWVELVIIQILAPNASFLGHLSGIAAGWLYVCWSRIRQRQIRQSPTPRFYGSGRLGSR